VFYGRESENYNYYKSAGHQKMALRFYKARAIKMGTDKEIRPFAGKAYGSLLEGAVTVGD
jgi:hypothetical protein